MMRAILFSSVLTALAACDAVGPDYVAPTISLSDNFVEGGSAQSVEPSQNRWWSSLGDKRLDEIVSRGLARNLTVGSAMQAVRAAQANARAAGIANQVSGGLNGSASRVGVSDVAGIAVDDFTLRSATLGAGMALAGTNRVQERALASLDAASLDVGTARLAYLSSVVGAYIDARYYQEVLELTRQSVSNNRRILEIVEGERDVGDAAPLNVAQAQAQLSTVRARLPDLESAFLANVYNIASLVSEPAAPLLGTMQSGAPQPIPRTSPEVGVPANLLRNRPDVQAAERRYAAAVAAIGVAEAQLYPSISLSGTVSSSSLVDTWTFGPALSLPVFDRGALKARRDAAMAEADGAEIAWRQSVQQAVQDVQSAQSAYRLAKREVNVLREAVAANQTVFDLTERAYRIGEIGLLDLLDAELALTAAHASLAGAMQQAASSWLQLQIATGSGWAVAP